MAGERGQQVVSSGRYQIVWCPKYGRPVLTEKVALRLKQIVLAAVADKNVKIIELGIKPDRVSILVDVPPEIFTHQLVSFLKSSSSSILRAEFPWLRSRLPSLWSRAYYIHTIGTPADENAVKAFVASQKYSSLKKQQGGES